jgi:hypothetical protein
MMPLQTAYRRSARLLRPLIAGASPAIAASSTIRRPDAVEPALVIESVDHLRLRVSRAQAQGHEQKKLDGIVFLR